MYTKVDVLGVEFDHVTKSQLVNTLKLNLEENKKSFVVTANPEIVMYAKENKGYFETIKKADYIIADGIGVIYGAKILKRNLPERIPGFEVFIELLEYANKTKKKVYFLGATQEVVNALNNNVKRDYPNLHIAGARNGYFDLDDLSVFDEVQASDADMVFVATGLPRQEQWIEKYWNQIDKGVYIGVGGSFDVLADKVKRAPEIWQRLNLEWLYRLLSQPSRWKRMLVLPKFIMTTFAERRKEGRART